MSKTADVMLDLETLGTSPGCVILSIGAVKFYPEEQRIGDTFYRLILPSSCTDIGLHADAATAVWWMRQSDEARLGVAKASTTGVPVYQALRDFTNWYNEGDAGAFIWANSPSFDCAILKDVYQKLKASPPWSFWAERDYRTLKTLFGEVELPERDGVHHNALDDAAHQAEHLMAILRHIGRKS